MLTGPFVRGFDQLPADAPPTVAGMYGDLFDVGVAVDDPQQEVRDRAVLLVWVDEGTTCALEGGQFLDRAGIVIGDRVHAEIAKYGSSRALNLDQEREFVPAGRADHKGLSISCNRAQSCVILCSRIVDPWPGSSTAARGRWKDGVSVAGILPARC